MPFASIIPAADGSGECAICMEPLDAMAAVGGFAKMRRIGLPCKHKFHAACLKKWAAKHTTCPYCREEVTADALKGMGISLAQSTGALPEPRAKDGHLEDATAEHSARANTRLFAARMTRSFRLVRLSLRRPTHSRVSPAVLAS